MGSPTLNVTETASSKVKEIQASRDRKDMAVRVSVTEETPAAFKYTLQFVERDSKSDADDVVDAKGVLFYIDAESVPRLTGATLDFVDEFNGAGFKFDNPNKPPLLHDPLAARVAQVLEERVNPNVAAHGGSVALLDVRDNKVYVRFGGGCQGCGMADVTLKQGIEAMIKEEIPEITAVLDTTDHAAGTNPYYQPGQ
jgi:Fe/S biogenesis protein NfuA